ITDFNKMLHRLIGEDIEIEMKLADKDLNIYADPGQIEQILMNLFVNARDAINMCRKAGKNKKITVQTETIDISKTLILSSITIKEGQYILISITDTGMGMDKETLNHIFEPFFTTKEVNQGTGLGLSTAYGIVKQNNAYISVDSESGKGTTFKIYWPSTKEDYQAQIFEKSSEENYKGDETILYAEDDEMIREITLQILSTQGYHVISCSNGQEALDKAKALEFKFDILITDVIMPKMGGVDLSEKILEESPEMKIILCSGYNEEIKLQSWMDKKNIPFLRKPFNASDLTKMIRELLDGE
ncbi:MAG: response regulator, partial [Candidatus Marinimicrobia bacterium]|nr:response regulator [Candidatus Neomarinimicrobiota bacterium]